AKSSHRPDADCHDCEPVQRPVFSGQGRQQFQSPGHRPGDSGQSGRRHRRLDCLGFFQRPVGVACSLV
ncbi:hypothetical protein, partial [Pseudomonas sp. FG-3G]